MGAAPAALAVKGVSKRFGDFTALRDIDLEVAAGEFVCFLGPSGCGKTTLLRLIAGLEAPSAGRIEHQGTDITREPPERRGFGIVFQSYALFPNLTVAQNIGYGLTGLARGERVARVRELLELVGLPGFDAKYPGQCSGGQQQRVALARALAPKPGVLLLDEPLSALDAKVRVQLRAQVKLLQHRLGVTTIMVTHDQEEALTMADRVVVMNHGVIEQAGTPEAVYREPATAFVAGFVGAMNFVPGARVGAGAGEVAAIRPEHVELTAPGQGTLDAEVLTQEFLGSQTRVLLRLKDGGTELQAYVGLERAGAVDLNEGAKVGVRLPAGHLRLYPA